MYPRLTNLPSSPLCSGTQDSDILEMNFPIKNAVSSIMVPTFSCLHWLRFQRVCWMQVQLLRSCQWWWWSGRASGRLGGYTALSGSTHWRQPGGEGWNWRAEELEGSGKSLASTAASHFRGQKLSKALISFLFLPWDPKLAISSLICSWGRRKLYYSNDNHFNPDSGISWQKVYQKYLSIWRKFRTRQFSLVKTGLRLIGYNLKVLFSVQDVKK